MYFLVLILVSMVFHGRTRSSSHKKHGGRALPAYQPRAAPNSSPGSNVMLRNVEKYIDRGAVTSTSLAAGLYSFQYTLDQIPDYTQFTSVFDQYRFNSVDVRVLPITTAIPPAAAVSTSVIWVAVDYDDSATPASVSSVQNYSNVSFATPGRSITFSLRPKFLTTIQTNGGTSVNAGMGAGWINCSQPSIPHFGVKVAVTQCASTNVNVWYMVFRYHVSFRSSR